MFFEQKPIDEHANKYIRWLNENGAAGFNVKLEDIKKYLAEKMEWVINGETKETTLEGLFNRFKEAQEKFSSAEIDFRTLKLQTKDKSASAEYDATFTFKDGNVEHKHITIAFSFNDEWKVEKYNQISVPALKLS